MLRICQSQHHAFRQAGRNISASLQFAQLAKVLELRASLPSTRCGALGGPGGGLSGSRRFSRLTALSLSVSPTTMRNPARRVSKRKREGKHWKPRILVSGPGATAAALGPPQGRRASTHAVQVRQAESNPEHFRRQVCQLLYLRHEAGSNVSKPTYSKFHCASVQVTVTPLTRLFFNLSLHPATRQFTLGQFLALASDPIASACCCFTTGSSQTSPHVLM